MEGRAGLDLPGRSPSGAEGSTPENGVASETEHEWQAHPKPSIGLFADMKAIKNARQHQFQQQEHRHQPHDVNGAQP